MDVDVKVTKMWEIIKRRNGRRGERNDVDYKDIGEMERLFTINGCGDEVNHFGRRRAAPVKGGKIQ
jgi:hypothetical protein